VPPQRSNAAGRARYDFVAAVGPCYALGLALNERKHDAMKRPVIVLSFVFVLAAAARLLAGDAVAPPGELRFTAHNSVYNAEGSFASWRVTKREIPGGDVTKGVVELEVDLASVTEKAEKLSAHLRTPDFLDAAKFQKATIAIKDAKPAGERKYNATASIDLHGVKGSCPVAFTVVSEKPLTIEGTATLDRTTFGVGQPYDAKDKYSPLNEVGITLKVTL
jgi:polyisoprenoid-binding protein YceI